MRASAAGFLALLAFTSSALMLVVGLLAHYLLLILIGTVDFVFFILFSILFFRIRLERAAGDSGRRRLDNSSTATDGKGSG